MVRLANSKLAAVLAASCALSLGVVSAGAQEQPAPPAQDFSTLSTDEPVELTELTCWDVTTLNEDDRAFVMVLLYGYAKGVEGDSELAPRDIQVAVVTTMMECVDKPDDLVLDVLKTHIRN